MQIRITFAYLLAFFALNMIMGELHEQAHIQTGYLICGCYGPRDFNVWSTCENCARSAWAILATAAGPLFSCSLMWLGAWWISKGSSEKIKLLGFALLFSNLPFARIFTALVGGGDEKVVIKSLLGNSDPWVAKVIASIIVLAACLPPMIIAFKNLKQPRPLLIIIGFAVIPLIYGMLYHHMFLNWLLKKGIGAETFLLGTPQLVLLHFFFMVLVLFFSRKGLVPAQTDVVQNAGFVIP